MEQKVLAPSSDRQQPDLLLELDHAEVTLGLVVVEGHAEVGQEAQDLFALLVQAAEQRGGLGPGPESCSG
jgi:acyl-CoA synthetase (NDP forming)